METRNGLITFGFLVVLVAFSLVFSIDAFTYQNSLYGVLAIIGFVVAIAGGFFLGVTAARAGEALGLWFNVFSVLVSIVFVWYCTRCGVLFGWW